jgi:uncharacterized membrane protein YbaN (DUF454 family)
MTEFPDEAPSGALAGSAAARGTPGGRARPRAQIWAWRAAGIAFVAIGTVGVFVPGLPTTPFLLLAAACYSRGDPVARERLVSHPRYGPALRAWFDHGAVARRAKVLATLVMAASVSIGIVVSGMGMGLAAVVVATVALVALWLWSRPERGPA